MNKTFYVINTDLPVETGPDKGTIIPKGTTIKVLNESETKIEWEVINGPLDGLAVTSKRAKIS